jgi:hypothetical protein
MTKWKVQVYLNDRWQDGTWRCNTYEVLLQFVMLRGVWFWRNRLRLVASDGSIAAQA